jgi:hypothetical protein
VADTSNRQIRKITDSGAVPVVDAVVWIIATKILHMTRLLAPSLTDRQRSTLLALLQTIAVPHVDDSLLSDIVTYATDRSTLARSQREFEDLLLRMC